MGPVIIVEPYEIDVKSLAKTLVSKFGASNGLKACEREIFLSSYSAHRENTAYWKAVETEVLNLSGGRSMANDNVPITATPEESRRLVAIFGRIANPDAREEVLALAESLLRRQPLAD
jgi:hypothetical protein